MAKPKKGGRGKAQPRSSEIVKYEQLGDHVRLNTLSDGAKEVAINVDGLTPPGRGMTANYATAAPDGSDVAMIFGQRPPLQDKMHAALLVLMPAKDVRRAIYEGNAGFIPSCLEHCATFGHTPTASAFEPSHLPGEGRVVYERARIMALTYTDEEADIRFWRVQPSQLRTVSPKQITAAIAPVVTVYLSTAGLANLLLQLQTIVGGPEQ